MGTCKELTSKKDDFIVTQVGKLSCSHLETTADSKIKFKISEESFTSPWTQRVLIERRSACSKISTLWMKKKKISTLKLNWSLKLSMCISQMPSGERFWGQTREITTMIRTLYQLSNTVVVPSCSKDVFVATLLLVMHEWLDFGLILFPAGHFIIGFICPSWNATSFKTINYMPANSINVGNTPYYSHRRMVEKLPINIKL